jgi:hypothetical protein
MTVIDWLACADPTPMLAFLRGRASERKFILFAVACLRRLWPLLADDRSRAAVEALERSADGLASRVEWTAARRAAHAAGRRAAAAWEAARAAQRGREGEGLASGPGWWEREEALQAAAERESAAWLMWRMTGREWSAADGASYAAAFTAEAASRRGGEAAERQALADLVREVFGHPLRSAAVEPAWLSWNDGAVRKMAQTVYDERRFADLPLLADALEDAGCMDADLLAHLRGPGPHVRSCWVVDLVLQEL